MEILLPTLKNYCILCFLFYLENTNAYLKILHLSPSLLLQKHTTSFFYGDFSKKHSNICHLFYHRELLLPYPRKTILAPLPAAFSMRENANAFFYGNAKEIFLLHCPLSL
jgi:hypothetical protein